MRNIENCADLPEIKAIEVEKPRGEYSPEELPEIKADIVEEYDPSKLIDHQGVNYTFYPDDSDIKDLMLTSELRLISDKNRYFLRGKRARMITSILPSQTEEAVRLVTAPLSHKGVLTKFINQNKNKPKTGRCLLVSFTKKTQRDKGLGYVSPVIQSIDYRRGQNGRI